MPQIDDVCCLFTQLFVPAGREIQTVNQRGKQEHCEVRLIVGRSSVLNRLQEGISSAVFI